MGTAAATTIVRAATSAEIDEVLGWTHAWWALSEPLEAYRARTRRFMAHPWGQGHYGFHLAMDADGAPVGACKTYALDLLVEGGPGRAIGFGAVFTREERRGEGHASRMLEQLAAEAAAQGAIAALLFSDIGPSVYARMGYRDLAVRDGRAEAIPGEGHFVPLEGPVPAAMRRYGPLALARPDDYWSYLLMRGENELLAWLPPGAEAPQGFLALDQDDEEHLWVEEAGWLPDADPTAFWTDVRRLAWERKRAKAGCWAPPEAGAAGFVATPMTKPLAMALPLNGATLPATTHLWSLDHF